MIGLPPEKGLRLWGKSWHIEIFPVPGRESPDDSEFHATVAAAAQRWLRIVTRFIYGHRKVVIPF